MTEPRRALPPAILLLTLALAACGSAPTPQPTATVAMATAAPTATSISSPAPPPTGTVSVRPSPEPTTPSDQLAPGWQRQTNDQLSIAIPPGWRAIDLSGAGAQEVFDRLKENDPNAAGILGGPEALQGAALWAFGPQPPGPVESGFVDSLNVRRSPLGAQGITGMQQVVDVLLPEYEKMGLRVTSTDATLHVNDWPAARVTYTLTTNTEDGKPVEIRGRQVLVATSTDLWILSFSTVPEREGEMAVQFETSAQSFEPK